MTVKAASAKPNRPDVATLGVIPFAELVTGHRHAVRDRIREAEAPCGNDDQVARRAQLGLQKILMAIEHHPRSARTRKLVRIVADIYERNEFRIDVEDLKALNPILAAACIDCLMYCVLRARTAELGC